MALARGVLGHQPVLQSAVLKSPLTLLLIGLLAVLSLGSKSFQILYSQDEAILLLYPDLILRGYVPYRDFASLYPPGNLYLLASAFHLFGPSIIVERFIGLGYQFLMAASVYFLGARISWTIGVLAAVAMLEVLHFFPVAGAYSMFGALAVLLLGLLCANRGCAATNAADQKQWAMLAGLLASLVYWFRQDVGIVGTLAVVVTLCPRNLNQLRSFSTGFALPACMLLVFTMLVGPANMFDSLVLDVLRSTPGRKLPIEVSPGLLVLMICIAANVVIALTVRNSNDRPHLAWLARGIAIVCIGLLPSALQRADRWHLAYVGSAVAGLTVVSLGVMLLRLNCHSRNRRIGAIVLVVAAITAFGAKHARSLGEYDRDTPKLVSKDRWIVSPLSPHEQASLSDADSLLREIDRVATPGSRLFVGPSDLKFSNYNDTFFYYLLPDLRPASRYLEMNPGGANRLGSGLAAEIALADWLILTSRYRNWAEPNASMIAGSSLPNEVISRLFCVHSEYGVWQLLRRCERKSAPTTQLNSVFDGN